MEVEIRPDKYVRNNLTSGFVLSFGESVRRSHKGIEVMDKFPGDLGTLLTTNFRVFWYSDTHAGRNLYVLECTRLYMMYHCTPSCDQEGHYTEQFLYRTRSTLLNIKVICGASIGFEKVIAVGRRKIYSGEPDETQVLCLLTYDSPFHREYVFKNCNNLYDLDHIKVILDIFSFIWMNMSGIPVSVPHYSSDSIFRFPLFNTFTALTAELDGSRANNMAYTSTRSYHDVLINCDLIEDRQLNVLPSEEIISCVDGVWNLNYVERPLGTFMLTNIRAVWFAYENETNNLSVPFLCVEKVNCVPTEYGEAFVVEVLEDNKLYGWRFMAETEEKQAFVLGSLCDLLYHFKECPFVGF